jgi:hypothetical protein
MSEKAAFERKLAYHTAPALLGIKCANLISLKKSEFDLTANTSLFNLKASSKGLKIKILCSCKNRVLILLYNEKMLSRQLEATRSKEILGRYGYPENVTTEAALERLAARIEHSESFPHEVGIFLGYPVEDVIGFIDNGGENYSFCGYWKVYSNEERAKRTFENYDKCRNFLCNKLNQGYDIYQALRIS